MNSLAQSILKEDRLTKAEEFLKRHKKKIIDDLCDLGNLDLQWLGNKLDECPRQLRRIINFTLFAFISDLELDVMRDECGKTNILRNELDNLFYWHIFYYFKLGQLKEALQQSK